MIYRNWVSVFLIKKSVFLIKNRCDSDQKFVSKIGFPFEKSVLKNRSSLSKIRVATGGVETRWLGWQFLNGL